MKLISAKPKTIATKSFLRRFVANSVSALGLLRALRATYGAPWRILMYHRVIDPEVVSYPVQPGMYVRPRTFRMHMEYLRDHCHVIPIDTLVSHLKTNTPIPTGTVVLTFDDGWKDNFDHAFPILRQFKLPATVFLATAIIGTNQTLWTDRLALALSALHKHKEHRRTIIEKIHSHDELVPDVRKTLKEIFSADGELPLDSVDPFTELVKGLPQPQRAGVVNTLAQLAQEFAGFQLERSFLNWNEVLEMSKHGISFGCHSHQHLHLHELGAQQIADDIENSLQIFREQAIRPSSVFCYPGGYHGLVAQRVLFEKGFRWALAHTADDDFSSSPRLLHRIGIHDDISSTLPLFTARIWAPMFF